MTAERAGLPGGSGGKESACNAGDLGLIPGSGRSPIGGSGNPLRILAWRFPWTENLAGYSPWGHRVIHDWGANTHTHTHTHTHKTGWFE